MEWPESIAYANHKPHWCLVCSRWCDYLGQHGAECRIAAERFKMDITPRYTPSHVIVVGGDSGKITGDLRVEQAIFHPAGTAPTGCPIRIDCNVLELRTHYGSRWYGCKKAYINSELRMVVVGFPARFEEMAAWEVCKIA